MARKAVIMTLALVLSFTLLFGAWACAKPAPTPGIPEGWPKQLRHTSASVGTQNFAGQSYWCGLWSAGLGIPASCFPGVYEMGLRSLEAGEAETALGIPLYTVKAWNGEEPFEKPLKSARFMLTHMTGRTFGGVCITRMDSDIYELKDLIGKKVAVASKGELAEFLGTLQMNAAGATKEKIEAAGGVVTNMGYKAMGEALGDGTVDAVWVNNPQARVHSAVMPVEERFGTRLVKVPQEALDKLLKERDDVFPCTIKGGVFKGSPDPVTFISQGAFIQGRADLPEDFIYKVMQIIYEEKNVAFMKKTWALYDEFGPIEEGLAYSTLIPMHPGAAKFWSEDRGVDLAARGITVK